MCFTKQMTNLDYEKGRLARRPLFSDCVNLEPRQNPTNEPRKAISTKIHSYTPIGYREHFNSFAQKLKIASCIWRLPLRMIVDKIP